MDKETKEPEVNHAQQLQPLINGYLRNQEKEHKLLIPDGIPQIIHQLYPLLLFRFGNFKQDFFTLHENSMILEGTSRGHGFDFDCSGFMVYADLGPTLNDVGFTKGIHSWSIKKLVDSHCFGSIGVTTTKDNTSINEWYHNGEPSQQWIDQGTQNSFYEGVLVWKHEEIITVELDCDDWTVKYYKNYEKPYFQKDKIEPNHSYYFAMMVCNLSEYTKYQIVDNPDII